MSKNYWKAVDFLFFPALNIFTPKYHIVVWYPFSFRVFCWDLTGPSFIIVLTTIPAYPYCWPELAEHDVTLTSLTADLSGPWKISYVRTCKLIEKVVFKVWGRYLLSFLIYRKNKWKGVPFCIPIGARVKTLIFLRAWIHLNHNVLYI